jgi:hypothetical protein
MFRFESSKLVHFLELGIAPEDPIRADMLICFVLKLRIYLGFRF